MRVRSVLRIYMRHIQSYRDDENSDRLLSENLMHLPDQATNPNYFEKVTSPLSLYMIKKNIEQSKYKNIADFKTAVSQCLSNAKGFYEETSANYQDAVKLEKVVENLDKIHIPKSGSSTKTRRTKSHSKPKKSFQSSDDESDNDKTESKTEISENREPSSLSIILPRKRRTESLENDSLSSEEVRRRKMIGIQDLVNNFPLSHTYDITRLQSQMKKVVKEVEQSPKRNGLSREDPVLNILQQMQLQLNKIEEKLDNVINGNMKS